MSVAYQFQREVSSLLQGRGLGTLGISMVSVLFKFLIWCYISVCLFPHKILCLKYFTITLLKRNGSVFKKLESQWATTRGSGMLIFEVTMVSKQPSVAPSRSDLLKPILPLEPRISSLRKPMAKCILYPYLHLWFSLSWSEVFIEHTSDSSGHGQDTFEKDAKGKQIKSREPMVLQTFATDSLLIMI